MIRAEHQKWAELLFRSYIYRLQKKHFASIHLLGDRPQSDPQKPLLLIPNHNSWWDGFFVYLFNRQVLRRNLYLMMLNSQLSRYSFFSKVGAYGIDPGNPKSSLDSLRYTVSLLKEDSRPAPLVCMFPQGELVPWSTGPLTFKKGLDWIVKKYGHSLNIIPLAMSINYLEEQRAQVFLLADQCFEADSGSFNGSDWLSGQLSMQLERLQEMIRQKETGEILLSGKSSIHHRIGQNGQQL